MLIDKIIKFLYKLQLIARIYYFFTINFSKFKKKSVVKTYTNFEEIKNVLKSKRFYIADKIFNITLDWILHPRVVQYRLDHGLLIGDCDEHAIYWCTAIKKSNLAKKVWFASVSYKKMNKDTNKWKYLAHAICVFKTYDNKYYWCDYNMPRHIENTSDYQHDYCEMKTAIPIVGILWEVKSIDSDDTPKFGDMHYLLPEQVLKL